MKRILSLLLFCTICFNACGITNNEKTDKQNKDDAKSLALKAKEEYETNRNFEKAIELFEKAVDIDNEEEWMYVDMARVKIEIKDYEGAITDLKRANELKEKNNIEQVDEPEKN